MNSIRTAARELELPHTTVVHKVLHKRLNATETAAKWQAKTKEIEDNMLQRISEDEELLTASNTDLASIDFLRHRRI